jgi:hypothetical protein
MIIHEDKSRTLTKEEWDDIKEQLDWLDALENAGVDNWEGIDFARELLGEVEDD